MMGQRGEIDGGGLGMHGGGGIMEELGLQQNEITAINSVYTSKAVCAALPSTSLDSVMDALIFLQSALNK